MEGLRLRRLSLLDFLLFFFSYVCVGEDEEGRGGLKIESLGENFWRSLGKGGWEKGGAGEVSI